MNRMVLRVLLAAALGALAPAWAADYQVGDKLAPKPAARTGAFEAITWEQLVPKDWDPAKDFKNLDLSTLQDGDPRAQRALEQLRAAWDNAPIVPGLDGRRVRIPGFVVPLEGTENQLREFLLVPYFGACIHTPPPPANQVLHAVAATPVKGLRSMDPVWINGTLRAVPARTSMGSAGYRIEVDAAEPYRGQ